MMPAERTPTEERRWREANAAARQAATLSWPQAIARARALDDEQLDAARQGCTAFHCIDHGALNHERRRRAERSNR